MNTVSAVNFDTYSFYKVIIPQFMQYVNRNCINFRQLSPLITTFSFSFPISAGERPSVPCIYCIFLCFFFGDIQRAILTEVYPASAFLAMDIIFEFIVVISLTRHYRLFLDAHVVPAKRTWFKHCYSPFHRSSPIESCHASSLPSA